MMEYCSALQNWLLCTTQIKTSVIKYTMATVGVLHNLVGRPALVSRVLFVTNISVIGDHVLRLRDLYVML
jgi:hypothetical protein